MYDEMTSRKNQAYSCGQDLTGERSERVRYCSCHKNIKFISLSQRVMFFLLYGETNSTEAKGGNRDVIERYEVT